MQIFKYTATATWLRYPANVYLVVLPNGKALLVDTGVETDETWEALGNTIEQAGIGWDDILYILLTHGHPDHYGMTARILEHTDATVLIHSADQSKVTSGPGYMIEWGQRMADLLVNHGVSVEEADSVKQIASKWWSYARQIPEKAIQQLVAPSTIEFPGLTLEVIPMPGQSLGSCCFYSQADDLLFSGDTLLPDITPNPFVEFGSGEQQVYQSLIQMRESLLAIRRLSPALVLPGHGGVISNTIALIDKHLEFISARSELVLNILAAKPLNFFELAQQLFQGVRGKEKLLALSEVLGHLGLLKHEGRVLRRQMAGAVQWARVSA